MEWNGQVSDLVLQEEEVAAAKWISKPELKQNLVDHPDQFVANAHLWPQLFNL